MPLTRRQLLARSAVAAAAVGAGSVAIDAITPRILPPAQNVDRNESYWARALPAASPALSRSTDTDLAVIGGGFTGLSAACYLRRRLPGRRVVLLEAVRCGNGASARNGAMLLPSTADRFMAPSDSPGLDRRIHDLTVGNFEVLREISATAGVDAEIELTGSALALRDASEAREYRDRVARLRDAGIAMDFWERERAVAALGSQACAGAVYCPQSGQLHPGRMVAAWKRAAETAGVEIYEDTPVVHIEDGAVVELATRDGHRVRAPIVVLATNAYSAQLGCLRRSVVPVWDYVAMTPPLSREQLEGLGWASRAPASDTHTELYYWGLTRDDRMHIGGGPVDYAFNGGMFSPEVAARRYRDLGRALRQLHPTLAGVPFEATWAGRVDMTLDQTPEVGRIGRYRNIHYAAGFSGHGVCLTSVLGRILADRIMGDEDSWRWFPYLDRRAPTVPAEPFRWLGIRAYLAAVRTIGA